MLPPELREIARRLAAARTAKDEDLALRQALEDLASELTWLARHQQSLDSRLERLENSLLFRALRAIGRWPLVSRVLTPVGLPDQRYRHWRAVQERLEARAAHGGSAEAASRTFSVSVLLPAVGAQPELVRRAIDSVRAQTLSHWQLCVVGPPGLLPSEAWSDARIAIAPDLRAAWDRACGQFCAALGPADILHRGALEAAAAALGDNGADLVYSDEELIDGSGHPVAPVFKPDWSPDLLSSLLYPGQFLVTSRERLGACGGWPEYSPAFDHDLALRLTDQTARVAHIPRVLYQRQVPDLDAAAAARAALEKAVRRRGWHAALAEDVRPGRYALRWRIQKGGLCSIVICSRSSKLARQCLSALRRQTDYPALEIIVVHHETATRDDDRMRQVLSRLGARRFPYSGPFDFSAMTACGAAAASGEYLFFLNDDVQPLAPDWMSRMVGQLERPEVGVAGALLLYPAGAIQHAGIAVGMADGAGHPGRQSRGSPHWPWLDHTRNVSAVTGACLAMRRELFERLAGFDAAFHTNYNDVDLCLRVRQAGLQVVLEAGAVLRHAEAQTRTAGTTYAERRLFFLRWRDRLERPDPFYSPHLASDESALLP